MCAGGPWGVTPPGFPQRWKALRPRGVPAPFARSGSKGGLGRGRSPLELQPIGERCGDDGSARGSGRRPLHHRVQAAAWSPRPVCVAAPVATRGFGHGSARLTANRSFRSVGSESRGIAVRVRSRDPAGVPGFRLGCRSHRAASGPEKPPSVAAGGEGRGLAMTGRPATANDVDGHARGSRVRRLGLEKSRSVREGASDRGTWGPSRASRESGLGDSAVAGKNSAVDRDGGTRVSARSGRRSANNRPRSGPCRTKRAAPREEVPPTASDRRNRTKSGCSSLKCGLQMSTGHISGGTSRGQCVAPRLDG